MILPIMLKVRQATHTLFGGFEHMCAFGYALHEFNVRAGRYVLIIGSFGVVIFALGALADHIVNHFGTWKQFFKCMKAVQYRY